MCWWIPKDRQENKDSGSSYRVPDVTMATFDEFSERVCAEGSQPCPNTSTMAVGYCLNNGICCAPVHGGPGYCKCFDDYTGTRCHIGPLASAVLSGHMWSAVVAAIILFIAFAFILLMLIVVYYVRSRQMRQQENKVYPRSTSLPTAESQISRPGLSWRETSAKRPASRMASSSLDNVACNPDKPTSPPVTSPPVLTRSKEPKRITSADCKQDVP